MKFIKGLFFLVLLFLFSSPAFCFLNVGILSYNPPFSLLINEQQSDFFGFDAALMKEICNRLHEQCIFKPSTFHELSLMLDSGNIDVAIGSIIITPEREQNYLFSLPYKESYLQFIVLATSNFNKPVDLTGKNIAAYYESPAIPAVLQRFSGDIHLQLYTDPMDMLYALKNQDVDAVITSNSQATYWNDNETGSYRLLGSEFPVGLGYGIMTTLTNTPLMLRINQALVSIEQDGTYLNLYKDSF